MKLSQAQKEAALHFEGPALVLAVPGAGKTTVLLNRIENLIEEYGVDGRKILSITFSRAQARDMEERFLARGLVRGPHFATIHSFAYDIIRAFCKEERLNLTLIEGPGPYNKYALVKRLYYTINKSFIKEDSLEDFFTAYSFIKNSMLSHTSYYGEYRPKIKNFNELFEGYEKAKEESYFIDFDDMLSLALTILKSNDKILNRIRRSFNFVQVDEAQDTSKVQFEIIKTIAKPDNNLFLLADDDQSIYGFRGADPKDLLNFSNHYKNGKIFFMEDNYRSSEDIVKVSSNFIRSNRFRYKKQIKAMKDKGLPVGLVICEDSQSQANYLLREIKDDLEKGLRPAVLYRNNISSLAIMDRLDKEGIPYYNRDRSKAYLSHFVVRDILDILRLSEDTNNLDAYENIYYKLNAYLRKDYIPYLRNRDSRTDIFDALLEVPGLRAYQKDKIIDLSYAFRTIKSLDIDKAIDFIEKDLGYGVYLTDKSHKSGNEGFSPEIILDNLKLISKGLKSYKDLEEKLEDIKNKKATDHTGPVLSTVHSSKGLEFDSVYIIDLVEGEFPSARHQDLNPKDGFEGLEEERRLFYVAMTRAKQKLKLISLRKRNNKSVEHSQFFKQVREMKKSKKK